MGKLDLFLFDIACDHLQARNSGSERNKICVLAVNKKHQSI